MEKVYIVWNNSFKIGDICVHGVPVFITTNYDAAIEEFEYYQKLCKKAYGDPLWCYNYTLSWYYMDNPIIGDNVLYEVSNDEV